MDIQSILLQYDYALPPDRIAVAPATPRDSARLLVWDDARRRDCEDIVRSLPAYLEKGTVLVLNDTKVIPARLTLTKETGGTVTALFTTFHAATLRMLCNKPLKPGQLLTAAGRRVFRVESKDGKEWIVRPMFPKKFLHALFEKAGQAPLPPYIKHSPLSPAEQRRRYQSVFAAHPGSIAAPTASLHFTPALLKNLKKKGVIITYITLHVHLGTFLPLEERNVREGRLHLECYTISKKTAGILLKAKKDDQKIVAVGTTALRAVESAVSADSKKFVNLRGQTDLFIRPGYRFRMINGLLTNFHVPQSSLLMLVSAFAGRETIRCLYRRAIASGFRFFSFGDAMLLLPKPKRVKPERLR